MEHTITHENFILLITGSIAGFINAIAGGGTLLTFPALMYVGIPAIAANATSTVALLPASLSSALGYRNHLNAVLPYLNFFAPISLIGGLIGTILLVSTPERIFIGIAPFLILFATLLFMTNIKRPPKWKMGALWFQFATSIYGGYFGAGIGILMLATLSMLGFKNVHQMNALKVMLGFLINIVAALYFIASGMIYWEQAGMMTIGTIIGGFAGAHFVQKISEERVKMMITCIGIVISAIMFYKLY